ncbi:hypothetical protein GCM10028805_10130 [Spirosoma harenae]
MKSLVFVALAALPLSTFAQQNDKWAPFPDNGIYQSASDFANHKLTAGFDTDQPGYRLKNEDFQPVVKVDEPNSQEVKIAMSNLWGERLQGVDYRIVDGQLYRIEHSDRVMIYSKRSTLTGAGENVYFFSRKLDSPIHFITLDNLKDIYYDQPEKLAAFDEIHWLNTKPVFKAQQLVEAFYKGPSTQTAD